VIIVKIVKKEVLFGNTMEKMQIDNLKKITQKLLGDSRKFKNEVNVRFDRGFIGELLVFDKLLEVFSRKLVSKKCFLEYLGNSKKDFDIKLVSGNVELTIDAKSTTNYNDSKPRWINQHAKKFVDIKLINGKQIISIKKDYRSHYFYIFVDVKKWLDCTKADFYVLSDKEAKNILGRSYKNKHHKKARPKNPNSDDMWVEYKDIEKHKDNNFKKIKKNLISK